MLQPNLILKNHRLLSDLNLFLAVFAEHQCSAAYSTGNAGLEVWVVCVCVCVCMWCVEGAMSLRFAVDCNVLITLDIYNTFYKKNRRGEVILKKNTGQVSLRVLRFSLVSIIPAMVRTHLQLHVALSRRTNGRSTRTFKRPMLLRKSVSAG